MLNEPQNLVAAREYARLGWHVFPLKPQTKVPLTERGFHNATIDIKQIEEWWLMNPLAGIGIATGSVSKVVVVDIDPRNGGHESLAFLEAKNGPLPKTVESQTGGGGRHIFFLMPGEGVFPSAKPWSGVDIKADGGYVCAPFTVHPSGLKYFWKDGCEPDSALADLPEWLVDALRARKTSLVKDLIERTEGPIEKIIPEGYRDNALASLAGTMQRRGMSYESILRAILAENEARCRPPLPDSDVLRIVRSVARYAADPEADPGVSRETLEKGIIFLDVASISKPDPINWILDQRIAYGDVSLVVGPPASGKSWLTYEIAVAGCMGLPVLGEYSPGKRLKVLLIDEENPSDEVMRRLWLLTQAWGVNPKELAETLMVSQACQGWSFRDKGHVYALQRQVEQFQPDVVIFDSFVAVSTVQNESDATGVRQFFHDKAYPIRSVCGSTLLFVHHTNKSVYQYERPMSSAGLVRGSIDFVAAVDSLIMIETFKQDQQKRRFHKMESVKVRRGEAPGLVHFELVPGPDGGLRPVLREPAKGSYTADPSALSNRIKAAVLDILQRQNGDPLPVGRLKMWLSAAIPDLNEATRRTVLSRMVSERLVSFRQDPTDNKTVMYYLGAHPGTPEELDPNADS